MSTNTIAATTAERAEANAETGSMARLTALGRAELTLLCRNKTALSMSLVLPVALAFAMKQTVSGMDLGGTGLSVGTVLLPATLGYVLIFAVYSNLTSAYVARREELVLKRLRTGELRDLEILAGTALPSAVMGLAQCALLVIVGGLALDTGLPTSPHLLIAGLVIGMLVVVAFAAASSALAKSVEAAQLAVLPLMVLSLIGSGMVVPLDVLPDRVASVLELLPLSSAMELIRAGWTGGPDPAATTKLLINGFVWAGLAVFAVQRWFRWEPRR
ncbi:ABC transporter permease [Streptomyces piniterrae]|uniref:Transport permease protein n=1 Tax=Streptomyces piniterrae TaxID=2571125 RepID=A0A4U0MYK6_9ACTN|nr:ABC transporter permease [Streptomyces piniterrae]TJZ42284.1 ABC transporter permease [Streptomyces piniterrae]